MQEIFLAKIGKFKFIIYCSFSVSCIKINLILTVTIKLIYITLMENTNADNMEFDANQLASVRFIIYFNII